MLFSRRLETFKHKYGSGLIVGADASIGSDCYLNEESRIEGLTVVSYQSTIVESIIRDCHIVDSEIEESTVVNSHIAGAFVGNSVLGDAIVRGTEERRADLLNVLLQGVTVEGCRLRNFELIGPYILHADFDRQPRHRLLETNGAVQGLLQCTDDRYHLGCVCRPFSVWDEREPLLRKYFVGRLGWDLEVFDSIRPTFEEWRAAAQSEAALPSISV